MAVNQVATFGVKVDPRGAVTGAKRAKRAITGIGKSAVGVKNRILSMQGALLGLGAGALIKSVINTASAVESLKVRLKFLTGSTEDAAKAFDIMTKFASEVPFALEEIERASPLLLTVADDVDELNELLSITGDIAAVSGLSFEATAGQLQRAMAGGIASADLFRERGVKAFLGFDEGVQYTADQTAKMIKKMFREGTTTAKGATEELKDTYQGQVSMMQDAFRELKLVIADNGVFELTAEAVKKLTDILKDEKTIENMEKFGKGITSVGKAMGSVFNLLMGLPDWVLEFGIVVAFLGGKKAKLAIGIITGIILGVEAITKAIEDFKKANTPEAKLAAQLLKLDNRVEVTTAKLAKARIALADFIKLHGDDIGAMSSSSLIIEFDRLIKLVKRYEEDLPRTKEKIVLLSEVIEKQANSVRNLKDEYRALMGLSTEVFNFDNDQILSIEFYNEALNKMMKGYKDVGIEATKLPPVIDAINNHMDKNSMLAIIMANNLQKIADEAEKAKIKTKEFADGMADNIEDSIMRMVQGLMSFKDVVKSVFQYVAMEMVKANIAKPLAGALTGILTGDTDRGGNGKGGLLGSIFGNLGTFATGGRPPVGQASIVGERGAELFVPDSAGTVVPNGQFGGQNINVTYSPQVNALDPRTAQSVIAENAPTIVAAVRQAFNQNGQQVAI